MALAVGSSLAFRSIAVGRVEIDDITQQHDFLDQRIVPLDDRIHGQRTLADRADHFLAAGLNAFGDGNLALARQQLDTAHFAQIHPHRVIGPPNIIVVNIARSPTLAVVILFGFLLGRRLAARRLLGLLAFDDVDAHLAEAGHDVLDLFVYLPFRQGGVQLIDSDVAAFLALADELLDRSLRGVH